MVGLSWPLEHQNKEDSPKHECPPAPQWTHGVTPILRVHLVPGFAGVGAQKEPCGSAQEAVQHDVQQYAWEVHGVQTGEGQSFTNSTFSRPMST